VDLSFRVNGFELMRCNVTCNRIITLYNAILITQFLPGTTSSVMGSMNGLARFEAETSRQILFNFFAIAVSPRFFPLPPPPPLPALLPLLLLLPLDVPEYRPSEISEPERLCLFAGREDDDFAVA
jgi:hypothetical protein